MDRQNRVGSRPGAGGVMSDQQSAVNRRERLRKLAMETIDLNKDPYFMRNHLGTYECKLCQTHHKTEGSYLAHTQGRRHQTNLGRRAAREKREQGGSMEELKRSITVKKTIKIGRPGYKVVKIKDTQTGQNGLVFELLFPDIEKDIQPRYRLMSAFEQRVGPKDTRYQYILFAAEPYETVGFRIPNLQLDKGENRFVTQWDAESKLYRVQLYFTDQPPSKALETPADRHKVRHRPQIPFRIY